MRSRAARPSLKIAQYSDNCPPGLVLDGRLARIKGENILFSPSQKAIFVLNETAADIWRCLEVGVPAELICAGIADHGFEPSEAHAYVEAALAEWNRLGLLRPCLPASQHPPPRHSSHVIAVPWLRIRVTYPATRSHPARDVFSHLEVSGHAADVEFRILNDASRHHLFRNGEWVLSCAPDELPSALRGQLLNEVLSGGSYELALHAACSLGGEGAMLLCGGPGAGKTTLAVALAHAGLGFAGDDVVLLDSKGKCVALPFLPAVKEGAWPVLKRCCRGLDSTLIFRCPDGRRVRYPVPANVMPSAAHPVRRVILLGRGSYAVPSLDPISPAAALRGLLNGSFARDGELSVAAFDLLTGVINSAEAYCLTYSGLDDAVRMLINAWR